MDLGGAHQLLTVSLEIFNRLRDSTEVSALCTSIAAVLRLLLAMMKDVQAITMRQRPAAAAAPDHHERTRTTSGSGRDRLNARPGTFEEEMENVLLSSITLCRSLLADLVPIRDEHLLVKAIRERKQQLHGLERALYQEMYTFQAIMTHCIWSAQNEMAPLATLLSDDAYHFWRSSFGEQRTCAFDAFVEYYFAWLNAERRTGNVLRSKVHKMLQAVMPASHASSLVTVPQFALFIDRFGPLAYSLQHIAPLFKPGSACKPSSWFKAEMERDDVLSLLSAMVPGPGSGGPQQEQQQLQRPPDAGGKRDEQTPWVIRYPQSNPSLRDNEYLCMSWLKPDGNGSGSGNELANGYIRRTLGGQYYWAADTKQTLGSGRLDEALLMADNLVEFLLLRAASIVGQHSTTLQRDRDHWRVQLAAVQPGAQRGGDALPVRGPYDDDLPPPGAH